jgi:hypothetical protein
MREIAKHELIGFFIQQQQQASVGPSAENLISGGSGQVPPNLMLAQIGAIPTPSSVGSIANAKHPVDDIVEDTPCKLVIPYGRKLDKFREVGTAMALTGRVFSNPPLPEYAWVQVVSVSDESCEIDIPTEDGIALLGDARNQYILWHRRDIIINASPSPCLQPSQERVPPRIQMLQWSSTQWVGNMEVVTMTTTWWLWSRELTIMTTTCHKLLRHQGQGQGHHLRNPIQDHKLLRH